ncbi:hypothetical protein BCR44DRAFT_29284 [Catenaria anguillulae PL171]|uniref:Uncharacterized protein n=1 Tax=Catenaria anguillulae PL171 TaxID=765915 RepID=A0A1Y2H4J4_9FUNG|nr:hypothetical protein BCR44DRAFT_29284 [Catenaria anguillulae PL171]
MTDIDMDDTTTVQLETCLAYIPAKTIHHLIVSGAASNFLQVQAIIQAALTSTVVLKDVTPPDMHDTTDTNGSRVVVLDFETMADRDLAVSTEISFTGGVLEKLEGVDCPTVVNLITLAWPTIEDWHDAHSMVVTTLHGRRFDSAMLTFLLSTVPDDDNKTLMVRQSGQKADTIPGEGLAVVFSANMIEERGFSPDTMVIMLPNKATLERLTARRFALVDKSFVRIDAATAWWLINPPGFALVTIDSVHPRLSYPQIFKAVVALAGNVAPNVLSVSQPTRGTVVVTLTSQTDASSFLSSISPKSLAAKLGAAAHIRVPKSPQCTPAPPRPTEAVEKVRMAQDFNRMRRKQRAANAAAPTSAPPSSSSATSCASSPVTRHLKRSRTDPAEHRLQTPTPRSSARQSPSLSSSGPLPPLNFSFPSTFSNASTPSTTASAQGADTD